MIKNNSTDLAGAVLIGDMPIAWYETYNATNDGLYDRWQCDLYYMDLDGVWSDTGAGWYQSYGGLMKTQTDANIDFNWGESYPVSGMSIDSFSVRWSGSITVPTAGTYTFYLTSDNGARMSIDGDTLIERWCGYWDSTYTATVTLSAGKHTFMTEYFEYYGGAYINLKWSGPNITQQVIPSSAFTTASGATGLTAQYYNNPYLISNYPARTLGWKSDTTNGAFDYHATTSGAACSAPEIFVSRISGIGNRGIANQKTLLLNYFKKNERYWLGKMTIGSYGIGQFAEGTDVSSSSTDEGVIWIRNGLSSVFTSSKSVLKTSTPSTYLTDIANNQYAWSVYCGHSDPYGLGNGVTSLNVYDKNPQSLVYHFASCSPLRFFDEGNNPYSMNISGAHLYGGNYAVSQSLAAIGATKVSGGYQQDQYIYTKIAAGKSVGEAFRDWFIYRIDTMPDSPRSDMIWWFYPESMIGDPMIKISGVPNSNPSNAAPAVTAYSPSGSVTISAGTSQTLSVTASDANSEPVSYTWSVDGTIVEMYDSSKYVFTPTTSQVGTHSIVCTVFDGIASTSQAFTVIVTSSVVSTYTLTTSASGSGTITRSPDATSYASGTVVTLTATPSTGYVFSGWSGDLSGTTNPAAVTMSSAKSVTATFTQSTTTSLSIEAENTSYCTWSSAAVETEHTGYSGSGYVNVANASGAWIQYNATVAAAGTYTLNVLYANGSTARGATLIVNGTTVATGTFATSGAWTTWINQTFTGISLNAGSNTIRLTSTTSAGPANIDRFDLSN